MKATRGRALTPKAFAKIEGPLLSSSHAVPCECDASSHRFTAQSTRFESPKNTSRNQIVHDAIDYLFLAIQCRAKAGTRKKNTSATRSWMKNNKTSLPNSFSSILKKCVAHEAPVFQNRTVVPKQNRAKMRPMIKAAKKKFRKKMILSRSMSRLFTSATPDQSQTLCQVDSLQRCRLRQGFGVPRKR
jgi:hypothetical protein